MITKINHKNKELIYNTPNEMCKWRAKSLFHKEPITIEWLNSLTPNDVLWDVGANVGMYTIYAAVISNCKVFGFEPESQNYAILNQNIKSNAVDNIVQTYCIAIGDSIEFNTLRLSSFKAGNSLHTIDNSIKNNVAFKQGTFSVTLDWLLTQGSIDAPTHIKIDVDGIEPKIINGSNTILQSPKLKEILIEINTNDPEHQQTIEKIKSYGFKVDDNQVKKAMRKNGNFFGFAEHLFKR